MGQMRGPYFFGYNFARVGGGWVVRHRDGGLSVWDTTRRAAVRRWKRVNR